MRKTALMLSLMLAAGTAAAQEKVTVQMKWVPQAQFAGYYVAAAKGFYKDAGLDVSIKPGGPDIAPAQVLAANGADITVDWMPSALAAREAFLTAASAFVLPIVHDVIPVNMNTLRLEVSRGRDKALITKDRMRVDVIVISDENRNLI